MYLDKLLRGFNNNVIGLAVAPAFSTGFRRHARPYLPVWRAASASQHSRAWRPAN